jgi:hypothetical protein
MQGIFAEMQAHRLPRSSDIQTLITESKNDPITRTALLAIFQGVEREQQGQGAALAAITLRGLPPTDDYAWARQILEERAAIVPAPPAPAREFEDPRQLAVAISQLRIA